MTPDAPAADLIQVYEAHGRQVALLVRRAYRPAATRFVTPDDFKQQVGFVVAPAGRVIPTHTHRNTERRVVGMSELLIIREGRCLVDLYDDGRAHVATVELATGDLLLITSGGHAVRFLEETVVLEIKQGPFTGPDDKIPW